MRTSSRAAARCRGIGAVAVLSFLLGLGCGRNRPPGVSGAVDAGSGVGQVDVGAGGDAQVGGGVRAGAGSGGKVAEVDAGRGTGGSPGAIGGAGGGSPGSAGAVGQAGGAGQAGGKAVSAGAQACNQLTTTLCMTGVQCVTGTNETSCESQLRFEFDCDLATGIDFSSCSRDAQAESCSDLYPQGGLTVPDTCLAPITSTPLSDAQTSCYEFVDALCSHTLACAGLAASTDADVRACEDDVTTNLQDGWPCLLATAVGPDYASCIAAIATLPCSTSGVDAGGPALPPFPSCANAITFSP